MKLPQSSRIHKDGEELRLPGFELNLKFEKKNIGPVALRIREYDSWNMRLLGL